MGRLHHLIIGWQHGFPQTPLPWIRAPLLKRLEIRPRTESSRVYMARTMRKLFKPTPGVIYQLSPRTLNLWFPLATDGLRKVLYKNSLIQHLAFMPDHREPGPDVFLAKMLTEVTTHVDEPNDWRYCPSLVTLHIVLNWNSKDMQHWLHSSRQIIESRESGCLQSIRVVWADSREIEIQSRDM